MQSLASISPVATPVLREPFPRSGFPAPETARRRGTTQVVALIALLVGLVYLVWRTVDTVDLGVWWVSVPLLLLEAHAFVGLAMFTTGLWDLDTLTPATPRESTAFSLAILIPTYNEPTEILLPVIAAAVSTRLAHETWVLDDGARPEVAALAARLGARYLARPTHEHAEGGQRQLRALVRRRRPDRDPRRRPRSPGRLPREDRRVLRRRVGRARPDAAGLLQPGLVRACRPLSGPAALLPRAAAGPEPLGRGLLVRDGCGGSRDGPARRRRPGDGDRDGGHPHDHPPPSPRLADAVPQRAVGPRPRGRRCGPVPQPAAALGHRCDAGTAHRKPGDRFRPQADAADQLPVDVARVVRRMAAPRGTS